MKSHAAQLVEEEDKKKKKQLRGSIPLACGGLVDGATLYMKEWMFHLCYQHLSV